MFDHQDMLYDYKFRHNELLREAEVMRLLKQADKSDIPQSHLFTKVLSSVGHRLVSWGQRLERLEGNSNTLLVLENSDCPD